MNNPYPEKHIFKHWSGFRRVRLIKPCNWGYKSNVAVQKYLDSITGLNWHIHTAARYNNGSWN